MDFLINFDSINPLAIFVAALASNLIGGIWFSPLLFNKPWKAALGIEGDTPLRNPAATFSVGFIMHVIAASLLAALIGPTGSVAEGVQLGALIGFAFVFTTFAVTNLFERKPYSLLFIRSGYHIVCFAVMGLIIAAWR